LDLLESFPHTLKMSQKCKMKNIMMSLPISNDPKKNSSNHKCSFD